MVSSSDMWPADVRDGQSILEDIGRAQEAAGEVERADPPARAQPDATVVISYDAW
jgi:hypothetical protein